MREGRASNVHHLRGSADTTKIEALTHLVNIFLSNKFLFPPLGKQTKFHPHKADLAGPSPNHGRRSRVRDQLLKLLHSEGVVLVPQISNRQWKLLTISDLLRHFSMKIKSSSDIGVCKAIIDGR